MSGAVLLAARLAALLLSAAAIASLLRGAGGKYALLFVTAACVFAVLSLLPYIEEAMEGLSSLAGSASASPDMPKTIIKMTGIAYIAEFASDICEDFGEKALAKKARLGARVAIMLLALPYAERIVGIVAGIAELAY